MIGGGYEFAPISQAFVAAITAFVQEQGLPLITFQKGQRKDAVAAGVSSAGLARAPACAFGTPVPRYDPGQLTYHLRRLRLHGLITWLDGSHRYRVTEEGFRIALLFTRTYARILRPNLTLILPTSTPSASRLRRQFDKLDATLALCVEHAKLAV